MPWRSESIDGPGGGEGGLTSPPAPLKDFGYVVNIDVIARVLLHKAPLGPRPTPMSQRLYYEVEYGLKLLNVHKNEKFSSSKAPAIC